MSNETRKSIDFTEISLRVADVFLPATPIPNKDLFSGRKDQLQKTFDAVRQPGQHVIIYGERGVGKTSLANIVKTVSQVFFDDQMCVKVNCDGTDDFHSVWLKAMQEITFLQRKLGAGFITEESAIPRNFAEMLPAKPTPNDIRLALASLGQKLAVIFDEFDRLPPEAAKIFPDVIKVLSDYSVATTVVMVGVADTVDQLISNHASVDRALVQVHMPRMKGEELAQILTTGAEKLGMRMGTGASSRIVKLSQGLPHYTHLLGLYATRAALGRASLEVGVEDVRTGLKRAVDNAQHTIKSLYHTATISSRQDALFEEVLLACALAKKDELSFFAAVDVVKPLSDIEGTRYEIPAFARHLSKFCENERGPVLIKSGERRRYRYRFANPLLEPYVIMKGMAAGRIDQKGLRD